MTSPADKRQLEAAAAFDGWWAARRGREPVPDDVQSMLAASPDLAVTALNMAISQCARAEQAFKQAVHERATARTTAAEMKMERDSLSQNQAVLASELNAAVARANRAEHLLEEMQRREARARRVVRATDDAAGQELRPDPGAARTPAELVAAMREFRTWAGNPSFREMAQRSGRRAGASTMCEVLNRDELPERLSVVEAIIAGCGGGEADRRRFATAWRKLTMANRVTATVDPALSEAEPPGPRPAGARRLTAAG